MIAIYSLYMVFFVSNIWYDAAVHSECICSKCASEPNKRYENTTKYMTNDRSFRIITSKEWSRDLEDLILPVQRVIIAQTESPNCYTQESCKLYVRSFQEYHVKAKGWADIAYNFLVGGDGSVYEGRGWNKKGAHSRGYNANSICIALIGKFFAIAPPKRQLDAVQKIIETGIKFNKIKQDYRLFGHCQLIATDSPGEALYDLIKTWDHWSKQIY